MTHENYVALLVAADLARYVNGVLTIKIKQWESFLHGYYFSDSLVEHAIEVEKKKMSLDGNSRQALYVIQFGIIGKDSTRRFEDQDLDSLPHRSTESMVLQMVSELFHDIKDKNKDDDEDKDDDDFPDVWYGVGPVSQKVAVDKICPFCFCRLEMGAVSPQNKATMVNRPPASFFYERPPSAIQSSRRGAMQSTSLADSADGSVAARRSWAASGLSSGRVASAAAAAIYSVFRLNIGNTPSISRRSVLEAPLCFICIGYHWVSSDLSRKAGKRSNCKMEY